MTDIDQLMAAISDLAREVELQGQMLGVLAKAEKDLEALVKRLGDRLTLIEKNWD